MIQHISLITTRERDSKREMGREREGEREKDLDFVSCCCRSPPPPIDYNDNNNNSLHNNCCHLATCATECGQFSSSAASFLSSPLSRDVCFGNAITPR